MVGIQRYAAEVAGREAKFVKHPSTWLNGTCWLDEPAAPGSSTPIHRPNRNVSFIDAASRVLTDTPEARAFKGALKL